jgi:hypothetical protein
MLHLEFVIFLPAIEASFETVDVGVVVLELPLHFLPDVRVDIVVDHIVVVHLVFCYEAHVEEPILVVLVLHAYFTELVAVDLLIFIVVVFPELVLVGFFNISFFQLLVLEVRVIAEAQSRKLQEVILNQVVFLSHQHLENFSS